MWRFSKVVKVILLFVVIFVHCKKDKFEGSVFCLVKDRLIRYKREGEFVIVEVIPGTDVQLKCSYCNEEANREPKNWFSWNLTTAAKLEVAFEGRFSETPARSLIIQNVSVDDAAMYLCQLPYEDSLETSFNFLLDVVDNSTSSIVKYDSAVWDGTVGPVNALLAVRLFPIAEHRIIKFEILPGWSQWSECPECVENPIKSRVAYCRIKPLMVDEKAIENQTLSALGDHEMRIVDVLLKTGAALPCRGSLLPKLLPDVKSLSDGVPDFMQQAECVESCPLRGGKKGPRERRVLVLKEGSRAFIICPGLRYGDVVRWEHNNRRLETEEFDGMVAVDHFGGLHLVGVTSACKGNYTCVGSNGGKDTRLLELRVSIIANREKYWDGFKRHAAYLAMISAMSYLSFVVVVCSIYWRKKRTQGNFRSLVEEYSMEPLLTSEENVSESEYSESEF